MALAAISIGISEQGRAVIERWQQAPQLIASAIDDGVTQALFEAESYIKANKLSGQSVDVRSGALRQDLTHEKTDRFAGYVGTTERTSDYARTILGPDATTIKPVNANHLWVPIADNLTPSGLARMTPREAMGIRTPSGKRALRIFTSKKGNLVAFLAGELVDDAVGRELGLVRGESRTAVSAGRYKRGKKKGLLKGKLLFVLKDQVIVQGTDALAGGVREMQPRISTILTEHLERAGGSI